MVKEIFHQVLLHVAGVCCFIGMLSLCRCNRWLECFASGGISRCWSKANALWSWQTDRTGSGWKCHLKVSHFSSFIGDFASRLWLLMGKCSLEQSDCASTSLCLQAVGRFQHSNVSLGSSLCYSLCEGMGKRDDVNPGGANPPPLGWEL